MARHSKKDSAATRKPRNNAKVSDFKIVDGVLMKYLGKDRIVTIPSNVVEIGKGAFKNNNTIVAVRIPEGVTYIGTSAFLDCQKLKKVNIPDTIVEIADWAFASCSSLESLHLGSNVKRIGWQAFAGCEKITEVKIPDSVKYIGSSAFLCCHGLVNVVIGRGVNHIGNYAFLGQKLKSVTLLSNVREIGLKTFKCGSIEEIKVPENFKLTRRFPKTCKVTRMKI